MFQATRRRLASWYTAVTAVLLVLFASGFYLYVRNTLIDRIDDTLNHVVEVIERSLVIEPVNSPISPSSAMRVALYQVNVEASFRNNVDAAADDDHIDLEWFSPTGELLWSTLSEPLDIPLHTHRNGETVRLTDHHWSLITQLSADPNPTSQKMVLRQVTDRVERGRQVLGYLRVSHPWFEVTKPIRQLLTDLAMGGAMILISVAAIGWFLSELAIEPVRESYQHLKQFTADASHELRSPIATIQTNVQVALAEPDLNADIHQQLQVIERLTRRLGRLVDDLLFLARTDGKIVESQFTSVPLDALLMEVIEEQSANAEAADISLSLNLVDPPSLWWAGDTLPPETETDWFTVEGDRHQLVRLLINLVSNSLRYTPRGGEVSLTLQYLPKNKRSPRPTHSREYYHWQEQFEGLQVIVKDNGIGIPPEAIPHIFDRFYRVDPARPHVETAQPPGGRGIAGSGLGLAIVSAIVENHRGKIDVESQINQGTTVTVTFPVPPTN
ncbi:sensor histidine kinase [Limnospira platensis CENA597]|uniref:sensor histidine kinase n=1 Tax=Limnospira platensis TaxID=118562 RepID=UPI003D6F42BD